MMRFRLFFLAVFGIIMPAGSPGLAQGNYYQNGHFLHRLDPVKPQTVLLAFSECLIREKPEEVRELLGWEAFSEQAEALIADLVTSGGYSRCLGYSRQPARQLTMSERSFRGALSEVLYIQSSPDQIAPELVALEEEPVSQSEFAERLQLAVSPTEEALVLFGDCVVSSSPDRVDTYIRTEIGSEDERQAIQALTPYFGNCLWEGQTVELNEENLRAVLATAIYVNSIGMVQRRGGRSELYSRWLEENEPEESE